MEDDEINSLVYRETQIDLLDFDRHESVTIEKGDLMRIFDEIYMKGKRDGIRVDY